MKFTGKCLCGAVGYDADGPPVIVAQCHCEECRRLSGTGHSIGAMFPAKAVRIHGDLHEYRYISAMGSQVTKASCATCGSPIYGTNTHSSDHLTLTLGSLDEAAGLEVQVVVFERDKPHWDHLPKDTLRFETQPDWQPDD